MPPAIAKTWIFQSDSNPNKTYETLQYVDGTTSCGCPGWTRRVAADGSRSCKHTRLVDMGQADNQSVSKKSYVETPKKKVAPKPIVEDTPVVRKIIW
jgi:hypothetical protein